METARGPIPLLVGVTGHRDVAESHVQAAKALIAGRFRQLTEDYRHTPIVVLSPLAEGADRIVADAALALHLELVVPLPFDLDEYRLDFTTAESREEFEALLARAKTSFIVPASSEATDRNSRYVEVGSFIAKTSDLLIALWDGMPARGAGGTAEVIDVRRSGAQPIDTITVSRNGAPTVEQKVSSEFHKPDPQTWSRIDEFNADAARDFPSEQSPSLFTIADKLAMRFHAEQNRALDCTFAFIGAAVIALEAYALDRVLVSAGGVPPLIFLVANLFSFAAAFFVVQFARRNRLESKSQDYRALAEALRIQQFWNALDLGGSLGMLYQRKHEAELEWVRKALRSSTHYEVWRSQRRASEQQWLDSARQARESWLADQQNFFERAKRRDERHIHRSRRASAILIGFACVLTLVLAAREILGAAAGETTDVIVFLIFVFAAVSALINGYADKFAWSYHVREYERMLALYRSVNKELSTMLDDDDQQQPEAVKALFRSLAREALSENADWLLAHRERPIEMPDT